MKLTKLDWTIGICHFGLVLFVWLSTGSIIHAMLFGAALSLATWLLRSICGIIGSAWPNLKASRLASVLTAKRTYPKILLRLGLR